MKDRKQILTADDIRRVVPASPTKEIPILGADGYKSMVNRSALIADEMG